MIKKEIPNELIEHIISFCDLDGLNKCLLISRRFYQIGSSNKFWESHLNDLFTSVIHSDNSQLSYRELYIRVVKQRVKERKRELKIQKRQEKIARWNRFKMEKIDNVFFPFRSRKFVSGIISFMFFVFLSIAMIMLFINTQLPPESKFSPYYVLIPVGMSFTSGISVAIYWELCIFSFVNTEFLLHFFFIPLAILMGSFPFLSGVLCLLQANGDISTYWSVCLIPLEVFLLGGCFITILDNLSGLSLSGYRLTKRVYYTTGVVLASLGWLAPIIIGLHLDLKSSSIIPVECGPAFLLPLMIYLTVNYFLKAFKKYKTNQRLRFIQHNGNKQLLAILIASFGSLLTTLCIFVACFISLIGNGILIVSAVGLLSIGTIISIVPYLDL